MAAVAAEILVVQEEEHIVLAHQVKVVKVRKALPIKEILVVE